jgi:hypothetical protein
LAPVALDHNYVYSALPKIRLSYFKTSLKLQNSVSFDNHFKFNQPKFSIADHTLIILNPFPFMQEMRLVQRKPQGLLDQGLLDQRLDNLWAAG